MNRVQFDIQTKYVVVRRKKGGDLAAIDAYRVRDGRCKVQSERCRCINEHEQTKGHAHNENETDDHNDISFDSKSTDCNIHST
jgi:hypothetical protein